MGNKQRLLGVTLGAVLLASISLTASLAEDPDPDATNRSSHAAVRVDDPGPRQHSYGWLASPRQGLGRITTTPAPKPALTRKERQQARRKAERTARRERRAARQERRDATPSTEKRLQLVRTIRGGGLTPKSIVADQRGHFYAMNMMYNHTISVFDRRYKLVKTIDDAVDLGKFGFRGHPGKVDGAPVEAAVSPDGKRVYVSNYSMYGPGFRNPGFDLCTSSDKIDRGFVYEIGTRSLRKLDAIRVGKVPKFLAVSPDGRHLLVGNWCSWDVSVVDLRKNEEVQRIKAGVAPRGIAFSPNSKTAYVTLVGEDSILVIDMRTFKVRRHIRGLGTRPRHLVMSADGRFLYVTSQGADKRRRRDGQLFKYDIRKRKVVERSRPLIEPRTTVMSDDGKSLYVVDYHSGTLLKLATRNLNVIDEVKLGYHPIGVTYDDVSDKVWVAGYGGQIWVLRDR